MRIRQKRTVLLLVFSLAPAVIIALLFNQLMLRTGNELASEQREVLIEDGCFYLQSLVDNYNQIVIRDRKTFELALAKQAQTVEELLRLTPPSNPSIFLSEDYNNWNEAITDLTSIDKYSKIIDGKPVPIPISFNEQVFVPVGTVSRETYQSDMARLSAMPETYHELLNTNPDLIQWLYTSFEVGFHSSYPGHGGYPADFDPRTRNWYTQAKKMRKRIWTIMPDVSTRRINITVSRPVFYPNGDFAGVTAIDVAMAGVLDMITIPESWQENTLVFQILPEFDKEDINNQLVIIAQDKYIDQGEEWQANPIFQRLTSSNQDEFTLMLEDIVAGRSGVRRLDYEGRDTFWAYNAWQEDALLQVIVVPADLVVASAAEAERFIQMSITNGLRFAGLILICVFLVAIITAVITSRSVTRPIQKLADAARDLTLGKFNAHVDINTRDELQDLGNVFNNIGIRLEEHQRMKQALAVATEIQQHLLPQSAPDIAGFDIAGQSIPCDETGGDYFDFVDVVEVAPGKIGIAVADVTGHGIGAGLLMATARSALRNLALVYGDNLPQLFTMLNRSLYRDTGSLRFVTLFYGLLGREELDLSWISAGHDPPLRLRTTTGEFDELSAGGGIPLGALPNAPYEQGGPVSLEPGDILMIGTDGIWEAEDTDGKQLGMDRVREVIKEQASNSADGICTAIINTVKEFREPAPATDDTTLVIIKVLH